MLSLPYDSPSCPSPLLLYHCCSALGVVTQSIDALPITHLKVINARPVGLLRPLHGSVSLIQSLPATWHLAFDKDLSRRPRATRPQSHRQPPAPLPLPRRPSAWAREVSPSPSQCRRLARRSTERCSSSACSGSTSSTPLSAEPRPRHVLSTMRLTRKMCNG